jgi:uncharacterized membrane protein
MWQVIIILVLLAVIYLLIECVKRKASAELEREVEKSNEKIDNMSLAGKVSLGNELLRDYRQRK